MIDVKEFGNQDTFHSAEILIVSEDPSIHGSIFDSIKSLGIAVNIMRDADLLPQKFATRKSDLIILDFSLPLMDGIAACRQLKTSSHTRDIPVVLMFAKDDLDNRAQGFQAGAVDYLLKPLVLEEVTAKLRLHMREPTVALQSASLRKHSGKREPQSGDNTDGLCLEPSCEVCTELPLQKRYFREIFHNLSDSIYLLEVTKDRRFRYLETNRVFETRAGVPEDGLLGRYVGDLLRPLEDQAAVEKAIAKFRRCLEAGSVIEEEITLDLQSSRRICRSTLTPLFDDSG
jgi:CheY-like chemotaxis protein